MYVIGTAGHVDHGKSTLVKTLTGIDPDRWEEEQRREMTIDLGFAWLTLPSGRSISVVDVPGHERFIKNMLAGVGGIDAALLVIAADESIMPQTVEHLAILDLLEVSRGLVVLTKADLVDEDWLALVAEEVCERLRGTTLANASLLPVSARTGQGIPELLGALDALLDATPSRAEGRAAPRLSVDRAFTIGGFGAIVTGTLADGPLRVGDEVEIAPKGLKARIRGLQTHQRKVEEALPGTRVAVNLAGVSHNDLARGDMLALPGRVRPTETLDARLRLAPDARPVKQNDRLELFVGAAESLCRVTLLDREVLEPGEAGWVQLRLDRPIAAAGGDRFILRQPSPSQTVGGGRIADPHPARHRRFRPEVLASLDALARGTPSDLLLRTLADRQPHAEVAVRTASGLTDALADQALHELTETGQLVSLSGRFFITAEGWAALREKLAGALAGYHRRYPLRSWMPREELRSRLKLAGEACDAVLAAAEDLVVVAETGVRRADHTPALPPEQERLARRWLDAVRQAPYSPPPPELEPEVVGLLLDQGHVTRVAPDVLFASDAYAEMVGWVKGQLAAGGVTVAQFRDRFGSSRKYALALLEHLDERRVTRRVGDVRVEY